MVSLLLSPPGWALGSMAVLTILSQLATLYNPTSFMKRFHIASPQAAQLIAFTLICINAYDLMGALQNNWAVYWISVVERITAAVLFWSFGPVWRSMVSLELATLAILTTCMYFAR